MSDQFELAFTEIAAHIRRVGDRLALCGRRPYVGALTVDQAAVFDRSEVSCNACRTAYDELRESTR